MASQYQAQSADRLDPMIGDRLAKLLELAGASSGAAANQMATNRFATSQEAAGAVPAERGAMSNFLKTDYLAHGGYRGPSNAQLSLPSFGLGPQAASPEAQMAATKMRDLMLKSAMKGKGLSGAVDEGPGWGEKLLGWAAAAAPYVAMAL